MQLVGRISEPSTVSEGTLTLPEQPKLKFWKTLKLRISIFFSDLGSEGIVYE